MKFAKTILAGVAAVAIMATSAMGADIAIIGGMNSDQFWNKIKKGVDDARLVVEANGGKAVRLIVQAQNDAALRFWERQGFVVIGAKTQETGEHTNEVFRMEQRLGG